MIKISKKEECCGCFGCYNICPTKAISMQEDEKGFKYPVIDKEKCINCNLCEKVCPIIANRQVENVPEAYACINVDDEVRNKSTSGGVFSLLAQEILNDGGVVFGAGFDDNFTVNHMLIEREQDLIKLNMSKYVQSNIGDTYKKAKAILDEGKNVLFTGTPCQIEGLYTFLMKDYDNLFTQDLICHGVPSHKVWEAYKEYRVKKDNEKIIKNIEFRNKDFGWKKYNFKILYEKSNYRINNNEDPYMKLFLNNVMLRDSCYSCKFKKINRVSDITLADFWGINKILPNMDDDKGTSLVIVNSEKGMKIFSQIKSKIRYEKVNLYEAIKYNPSMIKSSKKSKNFYTFYKNLNKMDFERLANKVTKKSLYSKIENKTKKVIKKIIKRK